MKETEAIADPDRPTPSEVAVVHEDLNRSVTVGREIGRYGNVEEGPLLLVLGGVHGNEPAGIFAAADVLAELRRRQPETHGGMVALVGNLAALSRNQRFIHRDLNRSAHPDTLRRLRDRRHDNEPLADAEEHELLQLTAAVDEITSAHGEGPRFLLDIHTTSGESVPYVSVFEFTGCVDFAARFPTYLAIGLERAIHGTLIELFNRRGWAGFTFEAGRHHDLSSVENATAMLWLALEYAGVLDADALPTDPRPYDVLHRTAPEGQRHFELIHRHAVGPTDDFVMRPGYVNFQPVKEGEPLADDHDGPVVAPASGRILMPLYQRLGEDGFFLVRERT